MKEKRNEIPEGDYFCKKCGTENSGRISYHETTYGTASLISLSNENTWEEYDNYDNYESDNFEVNGYECEDCGATGRSAGDLFTDDVKEIWKVLFGMDYPDRHDPDKPVKDCECRSCKKARLTKKSRKSKSRRRTK